MPARIAALLLLGVLLGVTPLAAAQTLDRGEIIGTVRDGSDAVLPGVTVTIRETRTGFERTVVTNAAGQYTGVLLPLGDYTITAELSGFSTVRNGPVRLAIGQSVTVNFQLGVANLAETVEVKGTASSSAAGLGAILEKQAIAALPINGRDYRDFALLAPTAQPTVGTRGTFRVGGQPGDYLALHVDGADFTNNFFGEFFGSLETKNFTVPLEAVEEFRVSSGGFGAEFGRSNGGLVNVVTKSGTNQLRGSAAYFLRHHQLTADDAFGNPPTGLVRHQFGASLGGPVVENRTFYFFATDLQRQETPITVKFNRTVSGIAVPELGIANLGAYEGQFPRRENVTTILGKLDHTFSARHRLSTRLNFTRNKGSNMAGGGLILSRATPNLESFTNQGISSVTSLSSTFGSSLFTEAKFQYAFEDRPRLAQGTGPQVQITDTGTFGGSNVLPATQDMARFQFSDNLTWLRGSHTMKFGFDYNAFHMTNNLFALAYAGAYTFPTLESFVSRTPSLYGQFFGLGGLSAEDAAVLDSFWQTELSFYAQDVWRPSSRLTLGFGLRYDAQYNPSPIFATAGTTAAIGAPVRNGNAWDVQFGAVPQDIPDDTNNWAPRAEVTFDVTGTGSTLIKGAAGLYYGRTPMIYFPVRGSGVTSTSIFQPPARFGVTFPNTLPSTIPPGSALEALIPRPATQYVDPDFQNPRIFNLNASLTRRLPGNVTLEAGYLFSDSQNLRIGGFRSTFWDRNLRPPTQFDSFGRGINLQASGRPDAAVTQANAMASLGHGRYHALILDVRKQLADKWQVYASYTLSKNEGNGSTERDTEALLGPSDPFDLEADYGINELDVRHSFKAYFLATLKYDIVLASTWTATSGLAFPVYSATDYNGDGVTNGGFHPDRPVVDGVLLPRFPYHQPKTFMWDFRASKGFTLPNLGAAQLVVEVFNLLGTENKYSDARTNAVIGRTNFRELNRTLGPRIAQLGIRFDF